MATMLTLSEPVRGRLTQMVCPMAGSADSTAVVIGAGDLQDGALALTVAMAAYAALNVVLVVLCLGGPIVRATASLALSTSSTGFVGRPALLGSLSITASRRTASGVDGVCSRVAARDCRLGLPFCFLAITGHARLLFPALPFRPPTLGDLRA